MSKTPWIVVGDKDMVAVCKRCGDTLRLGMPVLVDVYLAASKAFIKVHKFCQEKAA